LLQGIRNLEEQRRRRLGEKAERLVSSPLLVRMLLVVHYSERRLPEQRAELYMKATDAMLLPEYAADEEIADGIGQLVGSSRELHRDLVQHLAFAMHCCGETQGREFGEDDLRRVLSGNPSYAPHVKEFIALTRLRGTLVEERFGVYRFIHLAFQEFLTARYLAEIKRGEGGVQSIAAFLESGPILDSWWREPSLLVAGYLSVTSPETARMFLKRLAGLDKGAAQRKMDLSPDVLIAAAEVASMSLLELESSRSDLRRELAERLAALLRDTDLMEHSRPLSRTAAGDALCRLGDARFRSDAWFLPSDSLLGLIEIPGGTFLMGSDKRRDSLAVDNEISQHEVTLPSYYIARFPVTVVQFRAFIDESKYQPDDEESLKGMDNHPVVSVTWNDAMKCCEWLTDTLRKWEGTPEPLATLLRTGAKGSPPWRITLPSEAEWEKAARGTDGRIYPWGNDPDPNRANYDASGIGGTSAVGCFAGGDSPYKCLDMAGNVWEWTRSLYGDYPYPADQRERRKRENLEAERDKLRVLRGGSFYYGVRYVRCAFRNRYVPFSRDWGGFFGFRVAMSSLV
jgi:formylglycine-generating enzyme required for sulfatase activity